MTCIAGIVVNGKIVMGGDSAGVSGYSLTVRADSKVFRNGPFLMGFTSSFRMGQLLRHAFVPPHHDAGVDDDKYMATTFVNAVRQCLKDGGFAEKEKEAESGGFFFVGYKGKLYLIESDYQVGVSVDGCDAIGCGSEIARGSLNTSGKLVPPVDPEQRIRWALEAAERCSAGVRGPFTVLTMEVGAA